jgi:polyhydroxyalkanoate synthesis regulator phasin
MQQTIRVLESKDALLKHQAQLAVQKENSMNIKHDLAEEIKSQSQQLKNKNRSLFRQSQIESRIATKKVAEEKAAAEEESRITRLNELATRVPYYDSIMEKQADIHKSTEARKHDVYAHPKLPDFQSNNLKSFTNEKVFSNPNFR